MVHQPSGGYAGQASDIAIHAKEILRVKGMLNEIYARHLKAAGKETKIEEIEAMMDRDRFLTAQEAKDVGIVDKILDRRGAENDGLGGDGGRGDGAGEGAVDGINPST
jgi:ATP-dependent Clp protease protease subunit